MQRVAFRRKQKVSVLSSVKFRKTQKTRGIKMKNINHITKRYFLEIIAWAESKGNLELDDLRSRYDEDTANMFFISSFSEDADEVLEWVQTNNFFLDDENSEEKEERLAALICKKVDRDTNKYLNANSPMKQFDRFMAGYINPLFA